MSEDTEDSFDIPESDEYGNLSLESEMDHDEPKKMDHKSSSNEFSNRKSKLKVNRSADRIIIKIKYIFHLILCQVCFPSTQLSTDSSSDNVCDAGKEEESSFEGPEIILLYSEQI